MEPLKLSVLDVDCLVELFRSVIPIKPSFMSVKRDGFIQTGKWSRLVLVHLVSRLSVPWSSQATSELTDRSAPTLLGAPAFSSLHDSPSLSSEALF